MYKAINPATSAATASTTNATGLALMTAFRAACPAATSFITPAEASSAAVLATIAVLAKMAFFRKKSIVCAVLPTKVIIEAMIGRLSPMSAIIGAAAPVALKKEIFRSSTFACSRLYSSAAVLVRMAACSCATFVPVTCFVNSPTACAFVIRYCAAAIFSAPNSFAR